MTDKGGVIMSIFNNEQQIIVNLLTRIYTYKGMQEIISEPHQKSFIKLNRVTMINALKYTMQLSNKQYANTRVIQMIDYKREIIDADDEALMGFRDALIYIYSDYEFIDITYDECIKMFLEMTAGNTDVIRTLDHETEKSMRLIIDSYHSNLKLLNELECIFKFIYDLNQLKPFKTHHIKFMHLLMTLLLLKHNFIGLKYNNLEAYIVSDMDTYKSITANSTSFHSFFIFFLRHLVECFEQFFNQMQLINTKRYEPYYRVLDLLNRSFQPLARSDIEIKLADISRKTIERALVALQKDDVIIKVGQGKSTRYTLK